MCLEIPVCKPFEKKIENIISQTFQYCAYVSSIVVHYVSVALVHTCREYLETRLVFANVCFNIKLCTLLPPIPGPGLPAPSAITTPSLPITAGA